MQTGAPRELKTGWFKEDDLSWCSLGCYFVLLPVLECLAPSLFAFRAGSRGTPHRQLNRHGNRRFEAMLGVGLNSNNQRKGFISLFCVFFLPVSFSGLRFHSDHVRFLSTNTSPPSSHSQSLMALIFFLIPVRPYCPMMLDSFNECRVRVLMNPVMLQGLPMGYRDVKWEAELRKCES